MNLIWFLTVGLIFFLTLGEFGQFPFGSTFSISVIDFLLILSLLFLLIWQIGIKRKLEVPKYFIWIIIFWFISFISLLISQNLKGGLYLIRFIFYSSSLWLGYSLIQDNPARKDQLLKLFVFSGVILAVLGFFQLIFIPDLTYFSDFGYDPHQNRLTSTFLDPNFIGSFLSIIFILSIYLFSKTKNKLYLLFSSLFLISIILTFSRSAYLMLLVEVLIYGLYKFKRLLLIFVIVGLLAFLFIPRFSQRIQSGIKIDQSSTERIISWNNGLTIFKQNPVLGVGFNSIRYALEKNNFFKPHFATGGNSGSGIDSSFLLVLATTGVVGFLIFLTFWGRILLKFIKLALKAKDNYYLAIVSIMMGVFINSQFINSLFYPQIMLLLFILLGIGLKDQGKNVE